MARTWRVGAAAVCAFALLAGCRATPLPRPAAGRPPTLTIAAGEPSVAAAPQPASVPPVSPTSTPTLVPPRTLATRKLTAIARDLPAGSISVAALNTRTGALFSWGAQHGMWTGSVYKLFVLEALLLQRQGGGEWFDDSELADITAMIENSDNKAGYRMYLDVGGSDALAAAGRRLGLRHTRIGVADPAFTTMDGRDGIALLRDLVERGPLNKQSQKFTLDLMRNVQADQRWGVGAVADKGSTPANKNGWMEVDDTNDPDEDDGSRWLADSLGVVRVHGEPLLMAIYTRHNPDLDTGIRLVERLARIIAPAVT